MQVEIHFEPVPFFVYFLQICRPRELEGRGFFGWHKQENTHSNISTCNVLKFISIKTSN